MNQEFYSAYAAGTLDPALQLLVETQAAIRDDVRERLSVGRLLVLLLLAGVQILATGGK